MRGAVEEDGEMQPERGVTVVICSSEDGEMGDWLRRAKGNIKGCFHDCGLDSKNKVLYAESEELF